MIAEVQCLPTPAGTDEHRYAHIDAAITTIRAADVRCEVGALGTTIEGDPDVVWPLLRDVHEACLRSGAAGVVTIIKVAESLATDDDLTIDALTDAWRAQRPPTAP